MTATTASLRRKAESRAHLLVQSEAVRLVWSVHDVLKVLPDELEELLKHLLNLGLFERTHFFSLSRRRTFFLFFHPTPPNFFFSLCFLRCFSDG